MYIKKTIQKWGQGWVNLVNDIWLPLKKHRELGRDKKSVFCRGYNMPTLFLNLQKRSFVCWEHVTLQTYYPLCSTSFFPYHNLTIPIERAPSFCHPWVYWPDNKRKWKLSHEYAICHLYEIYVYLPKKNEEQKKGPATNWSANIFLNTILLPVPVIIRSMTTLYQTCVSGPNVIPIQNILPK